MSKKKTKPARTVHIPGELEAEILKKIGDNKTNEKTFEDGIFTIDTAVDEGSQLCGFYTYRGEVCILDGLGMDVCFSSYEDKNKAIIHEAIMANKYK